MRRGFVILGFIIALIVAGCGTSSPHASAATQPTVAGCQPLKNGTGSFTYVAIGASDAIGFGANCPYTQGYVPLLGQLMPANSRIDNLGISGATVSQALVDELPDALAAKPQIVTVWLAANDFRAMENGTLTLEQYTQQLDQLLSALQLGVKGHIYVANLPDLTKLPYFMHGTVPLNLVGSQTNAWNAAIATVVARHNAILVDLFHSDLAEHPEYIFLDGFHPSTIGYQHLAATFWSVIEAHGGPTATA